MKYQLMFPRMTKKLFDEKNGTRMTFAPVQSAREYEAEMQRILEDGKKLGMKFEDKEEE